MYEYKIHNRQGIHIAELTDSGGRISSVDDVLDLIGNADYQGCRHIVVRAEQLHADFFQLRTGMAGEMLQKFSTYRVKLGIIGDFKKVESKSLSDFIYESNKSGHVVFADDLEHAFSLFFRIPAP